MDHVFKILKLSFLNRRAILVTQQPWAWFFRILRANDYQKTLFFWKFIF